jgi:hypothetical protein
VLPQKVKLPTLGIRIRLPAGQVEYTQEYLSLLFKRVKQGGFMLAQRLHLRPLQLREPAKNDD